MNLQSILIKLLLSLTITCVAIAEEASIERQREQLDEVGFSEETDAQHYGAAITALWDDLRMNPDYPGVVKDHAPKTALLSSATKEVLTWKSALGEFTEYESGQKVETLTGHDLVMRLAQFKKKGWALVESEWHHLKFEKAPSPAESAHSVINISLHALRERPAQRMILRGHLEVTWVPTAELPEGAPARWGEIDTTGLKMWTRFGEAPFRIAKELRARDLRALNPEMLNPILVSDLDGDQLPDITLGGANLVLRNQGELAFEDGELLPYAESLSSAAAFGDFDGDGHRDLLSVSTVDGILRVLKGLPTPAPGTKEPHFTEGTRAFPKTFPAAQVLTTADVDGDGDLDAFLGQYMPPYEGGSTPDPFYDANDGHPSFLLLNDGKGSFTDGTEAAGLGGKRHRRNYAASFVDMDRDGHLDLVLNSDFAGVDVFQGNGSGQFKDRTTDWVAQPRLFGMTQVLTDVNRDARIDLYAIGMASTTARRLEQMKAGVPGEQKITSQRAAMGYGNRLYLSGGKDDALELAEPDFGHDIAESGWSWGAAAPDLDNNGLRDFYIANGHVSGKSASDYCSTFWRHDIYTEQRKKEGQSWKPFFAKKLKPLIDFETSWNGYEHNTAFLQKSPGSFTNLSFLLGISHEGDSRSVISADLDRDGDMDLLVTILIPDREIIHQLVIYENQLVAGGPETNWIGIDLGGPNTRSQNAEVLLTRTDGSQELAVMTTGGSFASQSPAEFHFGLGSETSILKAEVTWPDGRKAVLNAPEVNRWHRAQAGK